MLRVRVTLSLLGLVLCARGAFAQNISGTLLGNVTDASGAVLVGAEVTITHKETNQVSKTATNELGYYQAPYLKPGNYRVEVTLQGFKKGTREDVVLKVEDRLRLDFRMEVGEVTETLTVSGEVPLVESETSSLGQVIAEKSIQELPIKGRNVFDLVALTPGVQVNPRGLGVVASTGDNSAPLFVLSDISINGGRFRSNDFMLDGVSIMLPENNDFAISPTPDGTAEFKVMTNSFGPQFGRSGGGVINVVTKSGTNALHGTVYEFFRNDRLRANNFFANAQGQARGVSHFNLFGAAAGGHVIRDKTFFFAEYQGHREDLAAGGQTLTVPTAAQRTGNFAGLVNQQGQPVIIYDPGTTRPNPSGSGFTRDPFPGNIIPADRINPVALKMMQFVPLPNREGTGPARINNFAFQPVSSINSDQWSVRIDHRLSDRHSFFARATRNTGDSGAGGPFNTIADNVLGIIVNRVFNFVLNGTYTFSPSRLLNWRYGVTRRFEGRSPIHDGEVKLTELGFPAAIAAASQEQTFPTITFSNYGQWGPPGGDRIRRGNDIHTWVADQTEIHGRHTLNFGGDLRLYNQTPFQGGSPSGAYSFTQSFTQGPNPVAASLTAGDGFASLLTGFGAGSINSVPALAIRNWYWALYLNDEIKMGKLTLNAGLRYEVEEPRTERYNRFATFDFTRAFPIQVEGLSNLRGALTHPGQNGEPRGNFNTAHKNFGPRIGLAYRLSSTMALRAGYGIFFSPRWGTTSGQGFGASGYELTTAWVSSLDGVTPLNSLSNPFPTGLLQPATSQADILQLGQALNIMDRDNLSNTYIQQWNLSLQRELPGSWLVEAGYAANKGTRLPVALQFNQIDPRFQSLGNALNTQVANPFFGLVQTGTLSTRTVAQSQLLRPYPQYVGLNTANPAIAQNAASSIYHSLQLKVERRFSKGVNLLVSYTSSKLIDNASGRIFGINGNPPPVQNRYDLKAERSVSEADIAQRLVVSHTIELPFGKGKAILSGASGALNYLVGGWSLSGSASLNSGFPLALTSSGNSGVGSATLRPNSVGKSAKLSGDVQSRLTKYFDTTAFTIPATFTFGNTARTLPDVRSPGRRNYDFAVTKNFQVREPISLLFRAEAFNLTNTPYFLNPGTALGSGTFGVISTSLGERQVQFSLKLVW
jgi:Carboxypeptidase regulatory-like domain